ncbi:hypothetical protein G6011_11666 [Alternaria panax]|uniref:Uncharacterized protein n=1 Tax=Alternaria panax TaxID=48097 RepID=A0AAD4IE68_9PLEO|nr:hypothetical protein G6011_11666 [Alternaria panax]
MGFYTPTKTARLFSATGEAHGLPISPTDTMFKAESPEMANGFPMFYAPFTPHHDIKAEAETHTRRPTVSPITPVIKVEEEEEEEEKVAPISRLIKVEEEEEEELMKKPARPILRLPKQLTPAIKQEEEDEKPSDLMLPPLPPSKSRMVTRASVHKQKTISLKIKLSLPRTSVNKSDVFQGEPARNLVRRADLHAHHRLGVTPLIGKSIDNVDGGEFVGLSGLNFGDVKGRKGMGLYDKNDEVMNERILAFREQLWGKKSWAGRKLKG